MSWLARWRSAPPDRPAVVVLGAGPRTLTYGTLVARVEAAAAALPGPGPDGELPIAGGHDEELILAFLAALARGAVPRVLPYGRGAAAARAASGGVTSTDPDAPAYRQGSSGTTGRPKSVVISHRALAAQLDAIAGGVGLQAGGVAVGWVPFHHDLGLVGFALLPLWVGGTLVTLPPQAFLRRPGRYLRAIGEHRGAFSAMPTFGFAHCLRAVRDDELAGIDLSSLRTLVCAAEPVHAPTLRAFAERFARCGLDPRALAPAYGLAENVAAATLKPLGVELRTETAPDGRELVSCGPPIAGTRVRILDEDGAELPERRVGEIALEGDSLFSGYADRAREVPFRTGDLGYLSGGELFVCGRKTDLVICAGRNVHPEEAERIAAGVLARHARRVAAFGVEEPALGTQALVLAAELRGAAEPLWRAERARELRQRVQAELGVAPADVRFVPPGWIEVTTSGKIGRAACARRYAEAGWRAEVAPPSGDTPEALLPWLVERVSALTGAAGVRADSELSALGLDSLGVVRLVRLLELETGRAFDLERLAGVPTPAGLAGLAPAGPAREGDAPPRLPPPRTWLGRQLLRGPTLRGRSLGYPAGARLLRELLARPAIRRAAFPDRVALLERCVAAAGAPLDPGEAAFLSTLAHAGMMWRAEVLERAGFDRWVRLEGDVAGPRVIATVHTPFKVLLGPALARRGVRELGAIGNLDPPWLRRLGLHRLAADVEACRVPRSGLRAVLVAHALGVLERGGVVVVLADAVAGSGGLELPFCGRRRPFRPGAAELAVRAAAPLSPLFYDLSPSGAITLRLGPPIEAGAGSHDERVARVTRGFARAYETWFRTGLPLVEWPYLEAFLGFPAA